MINEVDCLEENRSTKEKIMDAAEQIFAEKGFDGARVDQIAKKAGINKAMLYYYFGSKNNILKEIIEVNISKFRDDQKNTFNTDNLMSQGTVNEENMNSFNNNGLIFIEKYGNVFKIILTEILKGNSNDENGFEMFDSILRRFIVNLRSNKYEVKDDDEFMMMLFFFNLVPMIVFTSLNNKWQEIYGISHEDLEKTFKRMSKNLFISALTEYTVKSG